MTKTGPGLTRYRQETLVMAKTSPRDARARRKSQPVKAAAGSAVASRASQEPLGDGPPPLLKATSEKTAGRRNKPAAPKAAAAAPKTRVSSPPAKAKRSAPQRRQEGRRTPTQNPARPRPCRADSTRRAAEAAEGRYAAPRDSYPGGQRKRPIS